MAPLNALDTWNMRKPSKELQPKSKCFLISEGANTEYWYFESLATKLAKQGVPELIELKPVERTDCDRNNSHPKKLLEQAKTIRADEAGEYGFEESVDRVVVVFDVDIYGADSVRYVADLKEFTQVAQVAVTNPSFELFLLLHADHAFAEIVLPNEKRILENGHCEGRRRYVDKLVSETFGINPKKNAAVGSLADRFSNAAKEEQNVNRDPSLALGVLTSNVGAIIETIIAEGRRGT